MRRHLAFPILLIVSLLIIAACSGGAASSPSQPAASASSAPSASASAAGSGAGPTSAEAAAELVVASDPLFAGFGPRNADMIGQCCWHEVTETADGYRVLVHAGWGDCPSGCINNHEWTFDVSSSGEVTLVGETGDPVPADGIPDAGM